jgi:hypothetical protein
MFIRRFDVRDSTGDHLAVSPPFLPVERIGFT